MKTRSLSAPRTRQVPYTLTAALALAAVAPLAACRRSAAAAGAETPAVPAARSDAASSTTLPGCMAPKLPRGRLRRAEKLAAARISQASRLLKRDKGGLELWETPHGRFWTVRGDFETLAWVLAEQEVNIYGDETSGVHAGDIVLDCGAHFGGYTRKALAMGAKQVIAIELAPENVRCLRLTFAAEIAKGTVVVYPKGVWHKDDQLVLYRAEHTWADMVATDGRKGETVPLTTIDKIVAELRLPRVDFIKMDIEGAEGNALAGAAETLREFRPRMALAAYHHGNKDWEALPAAARAAQPAYEVCLWGADAGWGNQTLFFR